MANKKIKKTTTKEKPFQPPTNIESIAIYDVTVSQDSTSATNQR